MINALRGAFTLIAAVAILGAQPRSVVDELETHVVPEGRPAAGTAEANRRYARGHVFDSPSPGPNEILDTQPDHSVSYLEVRVPVVSDLPARQSDIIILGTVTGQEGFFSPNRTGIYVESTVRAEQVFKGSIAAHSSLVVLTEGGSIRTNDGRVIALRVEPTEITLLPHRQFVLFLRVNGDSGSYQVLRAWLVTQDRVLPADAHSLRELRRLGTSPFQSASPEEFLRYVRDAAKDNRE